MARLGGAVRRHVDGSIEIKILLLPQDALAGMGRHVSCAAGRVLMEPATDVGKAMPGAVPQIISIDVVGTMLVPHYDVLLMGAGSTLVNSVSIRGRVAEPASDYSKHAMSGLTKTSEPELGPPGVRVNAVGPARSRASMRSVQRRAGLS